MSNHILRVYGLKTIEELNGCRLSEYKILELIETLLRHLDDPRAIIRALTYLNDKVGTEATERMRSQR